MRQNNLITELQADPRTYIESVGKVDRQTVVEALEDGGESTALRVCFGYTKDPVPLRSIGYVASALALQELYFPKAQVQAIHPIHAAGTANGADITLGLDHALEISNVAVYLFGGFDSNGCKEGLTSLFDTPVIGEDDALEQAVLRVLGANDTVKNKLLAGAIRRRGNMANYVASHLKIHDTPGTFLPVDAGLCDAPIVAERVISIGAQSERMFYAARMMCREAGVLPSDAVVETGQLFTRHVLPPYQQCRQGEPDLSELSGEPADIFLPIDVPTAHTVNSVSRDLVYLQTELKRRGALSMRSEYLHPSTLQGAKL